MQGLWHYYLRLVLGPAVFLMVWAALSIEAHPVSTEGNFTLQGENGVHMNDWMTHYSINKHISVGVRGLQVSTGLSHHGVGDERYYFFGGYLGLMPYRINGEGYQANSYVFGSFGVGDFRDDKGWAASGGGQIDFETQQFYSLARFEVFEGARIPRSNLLITRLGVSAYQAEFNEPSFWLIAQFEQMQGLHPHRAVTPLIRTYFRNVLIEAGSSFKGEWMLTLQMTF